MAFNDEENTKVIYISCHCGLNTAKLIAKPPTNKSIILCRCSTCRYNSGVLCTSYLPIQAPESFSDTKNLVSYLPNKANLTDQAFSIPDRGVFTEGWIVWFCKRCGSHVYRSKKQLQNYPKGLEVHEGSTWEIATGLVKAEDLKDMGLQFQEHENGIKRRNEGLWKWLLGLKSHETNNQENERASISSVPGGVDFSKTKPESLKQGERSFEDVLRASCHCGNVSFHITRPNSKSTIPTSDFSDLIKHRTPPGLGYGENPHDEKWWLRPGSNGSNKNGNGQERLARYFTGTCVCESCRLSSGFEIQAWSFIPKANIFFHLPTSSGSSITDNSINPDSDLAPADHNPILEVIPLDFSSPEISAILSRYNSRSDVTREFCPVCGATVFWRGEMRSELIDVSVGLLRAVEGAGAYEWLDWCGDRVSFMEEVLGDVEANEIKQAGGEEKCGREGLVGKLLGELRAWNQEIGKG